MIYDKGVELCSNEIFSIFHAYMVATPNYATNMIKHLERGKAISSTRIEPPLYLPGPEKIIRNFGLGADEFEDKKNICRQTINALTNYTCLNCYNNNQKTEWYNTPK